MVAGTPSPPPPAAAAGGGQLVAVGKAQDAGQPADAARGPAASAEELARIRELATQTKAIGIILPPPDIRAIAEKTAQFVARNGE
jgi:splicing factor 3A subunit 1